MTPESTLQSTDVSVKQEAGTARAGFTSASFTRGQRQGKAMVKVVWGRRDNAELVAIEKDGKK